MNNLLISAFDFSVIFGNILSEWYYYAFLLAVLAALVALFILKKPRFERNRLTRTQRLAYVAVLTALCTVVNSFTYYPVSYIAISFVSSVCFIAGYLLGAKLGFAVGFIGDLIGGIIFPAGVYNPIIGVASGLMGMIPGLYFENSSRNAYVLTALSFLTTLIVCTSGLNTFGLWLVYGMGKKSFFVYLWARLPFQVLVAAGNAAICCALAGIFPRILPKSRFLLERPVVKEKEGEKEKEISAA